MRRAIVLSLVWAFTVAAGPDPPCQQQVHACGVTDHPATLSPSDCRSGDGRSFDIYSFEVRPGSVVTATVHDTRGAFLPYVALVDAAGHIVRSSQSTTSAPAFISRETTDGGGRYDLIVSSSKAGDAGFYRVSLACIAAGEPDFSPCLASDDDLCLGDGRFRVEAWWQISNKTGKAGAGAISEDTGWFWFFREGTAEVMVKVLDACELNSSVWVFAGGLTDVHAAIRVTDTETRRTAWVFNPHRTPFQPIQNTNAIPCG